MAADVAKFSGAIDKVYKTFSTQVTFDQKELKGLSERKVVQHIEQKFQQQLQRARSAFLQEFRNHSVVVENEVRKIREELTERLEERYGERTSALREKCEEARTLVQKHKDEIVQLKSLVAAQETYLAAVRHRWGLEQKEKLRAEIEELRKELETSRGENADLAHDLVSRNELLEQLGGELSGLESELKRQAGTFAEEKRSYDERLRGLRMEMRSQQEQFKEHLRAYEEKFEEYKAKTDAELQIQDILNNRRTEALALMEEERQRHIKARTKPTSRIGGPASEEAESIAHQAPYDLAKSTRYRVDDMGMDTSWRDYQLAETLQPAPPPANGKPRPPKFYVERSPREDPPGGPAVAEIRQQQEQRPSQVRPLPVLAASPR
mmetsp:Transcript_102418/g.219142  ORF Transcript_102418/g.219142 Transcript_102418/m.219142 type:complete len:379 (-) Transcript_102418:71-1207(-)